MATSSPKKKSPPKSPHIMSAVKHKANKIIQYPKDWYNYITDIDISKERLKQLMWEGLKVPYKMPLNYLYYDSLEKELNEKNIELKVLMDEFIKYQKAVKSFSDCDKYYKWYMSTYEHTFLSWLKEERNLEDVPEYLQNDYVYYLSTNLEYEQNNITTTRELKPKYYKHDPDTYIIKKTIEGKDPMFLPKAQYILPIVSQYDEKLEEGETVKSIKKIQNLIGIDELQKNVPKQYRIKSKTKPKKASDLQPVVVIFSLVDLTGKMAVINSNNFLWRRKLTPNYISQELKLKSIEPYDIKILDKNAQPASTGVYLSITKNVPVSEQEETRDYIIKKINKLSFVHDDREYKGYTGDIRNIQRGYSKIKSPSKIKLPSKIKTPVKKSPPKSIKKVTNTSSSKFAVHVGQKPKFITQLGQKPSPSKPRSPKRDKSVVMKHQSPKHPTQLPSVAPLKHPFKLPIVAPPPRPLEMDHNHQAPKPLGNTQLVLNFKVVNAVTFEHVMLCKFPRDANENTIVISNITPNLNLSGFPNWNIHILDDDMKKADYGPYLCFNAKVDMHYISSWTDKAMKLLDNFGFSVQSVPYLLKYAQPSDIRPKSSPRARPSPVRAVEKTPDKKKSPKYDAVIGNDMKWVAPITFKQQVVNSHIDDSKIQFSMNFNVREVATSLIVHLSNKKHADARVIWKDDILSRLDMRELGHINYNIQILNMDNTPTDDVGRVLSFVITTNKSDAESVYSLFLTRLLRKKFDINNVKYEIDFANSSLKLGKNSPKQKSKSKSKSKSTSDGREYDIFLKVMVHNDNDKVVEIFEDDPRFNDVISAIRYTIMDGDIKESEFTVIPNPRTPGTFRLLAYDSDEYSPAWFGLILKGTSQTGTKYFKFGKDGVRYHFAVKSETM